jgi:hypothetical protein
VLVVVAREGLHGDREDVGDGRHVRRRVGKSGVNRRAIS